MHLSFIVFEFVVFVTITPTSKLLVCTTPRGVRTCRPLEGVLRVCHRITILGSRYKRLFSFAYFLLLPVNGSIYPLSVICSLANSSSIWLCMYSSIILAFFCRVHNASPGIRNFCSRIYTSDSRAYPGFSGRFCS